MTEYSKASTISDLVRTVLTTLIDRPAYLLLTSMYMVFFNVAEAELFSNATVKAFYTRIQLIIGIFMVFKLSISVLEAIVSPEKLTAKKTGTMSIIARIFISLALLTALTPINIPNPSNEYERKLKNNGLIFGVLYSFQHRVLSNNTLGILILGSDAYNTNSEDGDDDFKIMGDSLKDSANTFASTLLRSFMKINLVPEDERKTDANGNTDEFNSQNWVCKNIDEKVIDIYKDIKSDPQKILTFVNLDCDSAQDSDSFLAKLQSFGNKLAFNGHYVFSHSFLGGIAAYVFAFLLLTFTVDIAIRSIKLAVLRLIAPIPVISYMSPNSKDSGALGTWAKALTSTYLDIFIRLTMIYIVIYLIQDIIHNGIALGTTSGIVGGISFVLICLGLFLFAKQAPKFIKDALGIKSDGGGSVGLSLVAAGLGTIRGGGSKKDVFENMMEASRAAQNGGKDPVSGNSYKANLGSYKDIRDSIIKKEKDKYDKGLRQNYYERALDIDEQDRDGYNKRWWQSQNFGDAKKMNHGLKANERRYKANWNTYDRVAGRGVTTRFGSESHIRDSLTHIDSIDSHIDSIGSHVDSIDSKLPTPPPTPTPTPTSTPTPTPSPTSTPTPMPTTPPTLGGSA